MNLVFDIAGWILIGAGGLFCVVGAFGLVRMPDLYTRMHASGVIDPFGVVLILVGLMFQWPIGLVTAKLLFLALLLLLTSPVACHALGRAALYRGLKPRLDGDQQEEDRSSKP